MIIASDVTTLKQRGKYNGFIGASVAVGNGLGPLIGGMVTERASWQWCLWFIVPVIILIMILLALVIPKSRVPGGSWSKIKMIDWVGLVISIAAVLMLLVSLWHCLGSEERSMSRFNPAIKIFTNRCCQIPISEGGAAFAWNSPLVVVLLAFGGAMIPMFLLVEWRFARLPIMPRESIFSSCQEKQRSYLNGLHLQWKLLLRYFTTNVY